MSRGEELFYKTHKMEEDFYSYELSNTEDEPEYKDREELLAALRQKEDEVLLAAQVGKTLLMENRQLKEERDTLQDKYTLQLEELQQGRYELQVKLENCQAHWEGQVSELEWDLQDLQAQVERMKQTLSESEKENARLKHEHSKQCQRLQHQLQRGIEVEQTMASELQRVKQEMREGVHPRPQDEETINALQEQVVRLTQREQTLEQYMKMTCHENEELRDSVSSLQSRLALQEQQSHIQMQQLTEAWREVERVHGWAQELQSRVGELQEEVALQENIHKDTSLLSELENNLDNTNWSLNKEQVSQEVHNILELLRPVACNTEAEKSSDDSLQGMLGQLRHAAQRIAQSEALRNECCIAENSNLKLLTERLLDKEVVQQAIKDRDDAIVKKKAMEAELLKTKYEMMCLNNQLLEAIQRKLELSQELEAWQDDVQTIISQQLRIQQQTEQQQQPQKRSVDHLSFLRKSRRPSSSSSTISTISSEQNQSAWRDWLKLRK